MSKHLSRMAIDKVSLVGKGANARRIALLKSANRTPVGKEADDFDDIVADKARSKAFDEGMETLRQALWSGAYARDEDGNELSGAAKRTIIGDSIDQFKAYVLDAMSIEKAGRKISGRRLEAIKGAFRILGEVIQGVEDGWWTPPEGVAKEQQDMNEQEIRDLVTSLVDPAVDAAVTKALAEDGAITKALVAAVTDGIAKATPTPEPTPTPDPQPDPPDSDEASVADIAKALGTLIDRVDAMGASSSQQMAQDGAIQKAAGEFKLAGFLRDA